MSDRDWSPEEVTAIVDDYFEMLTLELTGRRYGKSEHRRALRGRLVGRTDGSVEYKHRNVSAVLRELGFAFIPGYKPAPNYQRSLLPSVVLARLEARPALLDLVAADCVGPSPAPVVRDVLASEVEPPRSSAEADVVAMPSPRYGTRFDFLRREAENRLLGRAGEEFVVRFERERLRRLGRERLAERVEHVAATRDGDGFDVLSFEPEGSERFIEVKTTRYGASSPFFVTRNELDVSQERRSCYHLCRLFQFRRVPKLFFLRGALSETCRLDPSVYRAVVGG